MTPLEHDVAALAKAQRAQRKAWKAYRRAHRAAFDAEMRTLHARFNLEATLRKASDHDR